MRPSERRDAPTDRESRAVGPADGTKARRVTRGQGEAHDAPRLLEAEIKQRAAWQLRREGKTLDEIADALGYAHRQGASKAIETYRGKVLAHDASDLAAWVELQMDRLEALVATLWPHIVTGTGDAAVINVNAIDTMLRIFARQAKLLGLDAEDQREGRMAAINQAIAEAVLRAIEAGLNRAGVKGKAREDAMAAVAEVLRVPVPVGDNRN